MKKHYTISIVFLLCICTCSFSQVNYTANDFAHAPSYNGHFLYGSNMGWYGNSWDDKSLADIAAGNLSKQVRGVGVKTLRPSLPEEFLESWGYDIRLSEFAHYATLGIRDNTVMVGWPAAAHRDNNTYGGCADQSMLFANLYEPIWDGGANGTPVNENNYFALYLYKTVTRYKDQVKFWEIMNEPDYDVGGNAWKKPGETGNWFDNDPAPCDLLNMKAPVFHYIRMLRISYDIIKTVDPNALVATGGLGYPGFLDAILRHTDNPVDGSVTADYPLRGGAYFDVLSFHSYPMFNLATWDNAINGFVFHRHSDAAVNEYVKLKQEFSQVLESHGYDGMVYPKKIFICTENNIPKKSINDLIGSDEAQRNYVIKALVESQRHDISQYYIFMLGDDRPVATADNWFQVMGLYQNLTDIGPHANGGAYNQQYTNAGIGFKTTSDLLMNYRYNEVRTLAMNLPANIGGAAFTDSIGTVVYVLWAKTTTDLSEAATAVYSFPVDMNVSPLLSRREWNFSVTGATSVIPSVNIPLTGTPVFLSENFLPLPVRDRENPPRGEEVAFDVRLYPNPAAGNTGLKFTLQSPAQVTVKIFGANGQLISTVLSSRAFGTGTHFVPFKNVQALPAGIYYCTFETDKVTIVRKLVRE